MKEAHTLKIAERDEVGRRLDNYLMAYLKGLPRQMIYRIIRKGEVRVNKGRVKQTYRLKFGDEIRVPPVRLPQEIPIEVGAEMHGAIESSIIFEDERLICFNKPSGLAVHGGSSLPYGLIEALRLGRDNDKLELAHRIDRDTSGCLVVCKNVSTLKLVQEAFRDRQISKIYHLFVAGSWQSKNRSIQKSLMRYKTSWGERRVKIDIKGQNARTDFRVLERVEHASKLEAVLHTGRTHQIRVHSKHCGNPIIGDKKYGNHEGNTSRLCLHASRISFSVAGTNYKFGADFGQDLNLIWNQLQSGSRLD